MSHERYYNSGGGSPGGAQDGEFPDFMCQNDEIDRMIEESAGAFNLSGTNIRNILYHVVLGGARDLWDPTEQDLQPGDTLEIPEPKTRAAKQKLLVQEGAAADPFLTLPEVRSPDHDSSEDEEEEDADYEPHETEGSEDSDDDRESQAAATPKSVRTPSDVKRETKPSECESEPATPSLGLAKRTRSLFSLKDRELVELESALPKEEEPEITEEEKEEEEEKPPEITWDGLEEELANEFDLNVSTSDSEESDSDSSNSESGTEADDTRFGKFLKGIGNPREEFPEDDAQQDLPYLYREKRRFEAEEFRTDKEVLVTKREMVDLFRDLDKEHPELKEQIYDRGKREPTPSEALVTVVAGPLFTPSSLEVLQSQLRMHLQLLVQHAVLADGVKTLAHNKQTAIDRIEELEELCSSEGTEGLMQAMEGTTQHLTSLLKCLDIYPAMKLAKGGKSTTDVRPAQPIPIKVAREVSHIKGIEPLCQDKYLLLNFQPFFHRFLHLRPTVNFICTSKIRGAKCFTEPEDNLLAHGLDAFQGVKDQKVMYDLIREFFLPTKTAKQIGIRVKNRISSVAPYNVIKHWKDTGFIRYDTQYTKSKLMRSLSVRVGPKVADAPPIAPAVKRDNLDWLVALREHRRRLQREHSKRRQRLNCTKEQVISAAMLSTAEEAHSFEIAFLLKAKDVLKNDYTTYFNVFKILAEYNQAREFDCEEVITKLLRALKNYPDLSLELLSIFSPLPDMPVEQLLDTLTHMRTRILLRNLEQNFRNNPSQYKKVLKMILGANLNNPTATKDTLLGMLRGKPNLCHQVTEFFDRCAVRPKANEFEYIDMTDKGSMNCANEDQFEEINFLEKTSAATQKHEALIKNINRVVDEQRQAERDRQEMEKVQKRVEDEARKKVQEERRKMPAKNVVECGGTLLTWTRDQDRDILRACRSTGIRAKTYHSLARSFPDKSAAQVKDRFSTLMQLMKKAKKDAERRSAYKASCILKAKAARSPSKEKLKSTPVKRSRLRDSLSDIPGPSSANGS